MSYVHGVPDERIVELYSEAEVACVPSLYEGFSLPAIEAMSCGVPLVTTTGGALPEVTGTHGETCFQVPPGRQRRPGRHAPDRPGPTRGSATGWVRPAAGGSSTSGAGATPPCRTVEQYRALLDETVPALRPRADR